jgi:hypothetical protein
MPVGPYGAQRRLQQDPPQAGAPLPALKSPPQTVPSTIEQFEAPEGGWLHVP